MTDPSASTQAQPHVGMIVCDCKFRHVAIVEIDGDDLILEGGFSCSWAHCCEPIPHPGFEHEEFQESGRPT